MEGYTVTVISVTIILMAMSDEDIVMTLIFEVIMLILVKWHVTISMLICEYILYYCNIEPDNFIIEKWHESMIMYMYTLCYLIDQVE